MHRRPLAPSRAASAAWARRLAVGSALLAAASVVAAHHPRVPPTAALTGLAIALGGAAFAILAAIRAMRTIWRTGQPGLGRAVAGLILAAATLGYPVYLATRVLPEPLTAASATTASDPPALSRSARAVAVRGLPDPAGRPVPVVAADAVTLDMAPGDAFDSVEDAVRALRWRIIEAVPPGGRLGLGHVDAVAFTPVMHLPQDIAIRVSPQGGATRIDLVSVARVGVTDFGAGATTIRQFADALAAEMDE